MRMSVTIVACSWVATKEMAN